MIKTSKFDMKNTHRSSSRKVYLDIYVFLFSLIQMLQSPATKLSLFLLYPATDHLNLTLGGPRLYS